MKQNGKVEIHSSQPLDFLLCGNMPIVSNRPPVKNRMVHSFSTSGSINVQEQDAFDFSMFPPLISTTDKHRPKTKLKLSRKRKSEECSTRLYQKIKVEQGTFTAAEKDLSLRADNRKRKVAQIHQDYEEYVSKPFQERLAKAVAGEKYNKYLKAKTRAFSSLGPRPVYNTLSLDEPYTMPVVRVSVSGLNDKIYSFQKNEKKDKKLEETILSYSQNAPLMPKVLYREVRPANEVLAQIAETRVFNEETNKPVGRKVFASAFTSKVGENIYNCKY